MCNKVLKHILIWLGAIVGLGAIFFLMYFFVWTNPGDTGRVYDIQLHDSDWKRGSPEAKVVLVEYSDFQCPACAVYSPIIEQLLKDYPDGILFVYRHFPLTQIHKNANLAAYAVEAAGKQGKFWEMYEKVFQNQRAWSESDKARELFVQYANELVLNTEWFLRDIDSPETKDKVSKDYQSGLLYQIDGTPSFFVNGKKIQNPAGYEAFKKIIGAEFNK